MTKAKLLKEIERRKNNIAKERDALRDLINDADEVLNDASEAIDELERAVEYLSRNL